jgi:hypothetical protein
MTVQRADLEAKLREIQQAVHETSEGAKSPGVIAAVGVVALIFVMYLLGRRRGRGGGARVEVYRVR